MKKKDWLILVVIFLVGYVVRIWFLKSNILTFGYDQARDAVRAQQILSGDLKIFGPPSSTPGLFHGVLYYYLLAPGYLLGKNPINAAYWTAFLNALVVFVIFSLTFYMTKKRLPAFLAAFFFALSFESSQYATWLSNPTIAVLTVPLAYLGLWAWLKEGKKWGPAIAALGLGFSIQAEIFLAYHFVPFIIWFILGKAKRRDLAKFMAFFLLSVSTMILAQVKFGIGQTFSGLGQLAVSSGGSLAYAKSLGDYFVLYLNQIGRIFAFNSYPGNIGYGGTFVVVLTVFYLFRTRKDWAKFLALWLFSHLTVVAVGGTSTPFLMVGIGPAVSVLLGIFISWLWRERNKYAAVIVAAVLIFGNLTVIARENKRGSTLFAIQMDMLLQKQLKAIDYTYEKAGGEKFSINTLTSPLWINNVWAYLYQTYGRDKYEFVPCFSGRDQIGEVIVSALPKCVPRENHFLIIEPLGGIPIRYLDETLSSEDAFSSVSQETSFGELRVQQRVLKDK